MSKTDLTKLKVGDKVMCSGSSGFTRPSEQTIKKITKSFDVKTGKEYKILWTDDNRQFDSRNGNPLSPPWAYSLSAI